MPIESIVYIDRDEMAQCILEALVFPDQLVRRETPTETLNTLKNGQGDSLRNAADAALWFVLQCLNNSHTKH